jgi:hypothetical protein
MVCDHLGEEMFGVRQEVVSFGARDVGILVLQSLLAIISAL